MFTFQAILVLFTTFFLYNCLFYCCFLCFRHFSYLLLSRTVATMLSVWGLYVLFTGLDILKIDKNSTDLLCFIIKFGGLGALF